MGFTEWWDKWPKKVAKFDAEKAYNQQLKKGYTDDELLAGVCAFNQLVLQRRLTGAFNPIPYPASWLRGQRWTDDELRPFAKPDEPNGSIAPYSEPTGCGIAIAERLGLAVFNGYFRDCKFTETKVIVPTQARADYIISKFHYKMPNVIVEVRKS